MSSKSKKTDIKITKSNGESKTKTSHSKKKNNSKRQKFDLYIKNIQLQVAPTATMGNTSAMPMLNDMVVFLIRKIARESSNILRNSNRVTLTSAHIRGACTLFFPGDFREDAFKVATSAVTKWNTSKSSQLYTNSKDKVAQYTKADDRTKIVPKDILYTIRTSEEYNYLFPDNSCVFQGGVVPHIYGVLVSDKEFQKYYNNK